MKVSCIFKTSDGREFLSKEDAYKHQALLNDLSNNPPEKLIKEFLLRNSPYIYDKDSYKVWLIYDNSGNLYNNQLLGVYTGTYINAINYALNIDGFYDGDRFGTILQAPKWGVDWR